MVTTSLHIKTQNLSLAAEWGSEPRTQHSAASTVDHGPQSPQKMLPVELIAEIQRHTDHATFATTLSIARLSPTLPAPTNAHLRDRVLQLSPNKTSFSNDKDTLLGQYRTLLHNTNALAWHTQSGSYSLPTTARSVAISPNESCLVTADSRRVNLWNFRTRSAKVKSVPLAPGTVCHPISFSDDGDLLATGTLNGAICIWDMEHERPVHLSSLPPQDGSLCTINFSKDKRLLLSATKENTARLWKRDAESYKSTMTVNEAWAAALSPKGDIFATSTRDGAITFWKTDTNEALVQLPHLHCTVFSMTFSNDGAMFATGHRDGLIHLWDVHTQKVIASTGKSDRAVFALLFSPDRQQIVSGDTTGAARVWDFKNPTSEPEILRGHEGHVDCLAFSPNARFIATGSKDHTVRLWDTQRTSWLDTIMSRLRWW